MSIIDLQINPTATAVLNLLSKRNVIQQLDENYPILMSSAWYNGRERGICLYTAYIQSKKKNICIVFGEDRCSDAIFVDHWYPEDPSWLNPPRLSDMSEEAYKKRNCFNSMEKAVDFIGHLLEEIYETNKVSAISTERGKNGN